VSLATSGVLEGVPADWQLDPVVVAVLVLSAWAYLAGARRARRWPAIRTASFMSGILLLGIALESGLHRHGEELLSVHMVQHLALTAPVPALLVLGMPVTLALRSLPRAQRRALGGLLHRRAVRLLSRPEVAWAAFAGVLVGTHAPPFYDLALRSELVHAAEHAMYLSTSLLLWSAVLAVEPLPRPASPLGRVFLLLATMPPMALVGVALLTAGDPLYPHYAETAPAWGVSTLEDQRSGGLVMWIGGTLTLAAAVLAVGWSALQAEERRALARERYADRAAEAASR